MARGMVKSMLPQGQENWENEFGHGKVREFLYVEKSGKSQGIV